MKYLVKAGLGYAKQFKSQKSAIEHARQLIKSDVYTDGTISVLAIEQSGTCSQMQVWPSRGQSYAH